MSQTHTVRGRSTVILTDTMASGAPFTRVVYHTTTVAGFNAHVIILNSGGYRTATTKLRMNQTANQFGLGYHVYQQSGAWFVAFNGETLPFHDDMVLMRDGAPCSNGEHFYPNPVTTGDRCKCGARRFGYQGTDHGGV